MVLVYHEEADEIRCIANISARRRRNLELDLGIEGFLDLAGGHDLPDGPAGRAELRLVVNVGSLVEDNDQVGLAHFVEHMAFNGSTHVPEGEMVKILERLGLAFGADTNASTGQFFTTYQLDLPKASDDLLDEMESTARALSEELGKTEGLGEAEKAQLYRVLGHGALKYFILKVDPRKRMVFNPEESIDFNGHTGPFIQYSHARIKSILRKAEGRSTAWSWSDIAVDERSKELIQTLDRFPEAVQQAARNYSPAVVAQFAYDVAKAFNAFYQCNPILNAESDALVAFRVELCRTTASALRRALEMLGIEAPDRM